MGIKPELNFLKKIPLPPFQIKNRNYLPPAEIKRAIRAAKANQDVRIFPGFSRTGARLFGPAAGWRGHCAA
jgi:hypothetical protein